MNLSLSPQQEQVRLELATWLRSHIPWEYGVGLPSRFDDLDEEVRFLREWQNQLAAARWVAVAWPEEYGGRGLGPAEHFIVQVELARARAPEMVGRIGINLAGPTLLRHGTAEQKHRWLRRILTAEDIWCQLFSEPGAGSDLASLSTRAERVDNGWVLNGQKVWTSYAQYADWGICLARTGGPGHKGISYLVVDMHAPGVEVRPLMQITGDAEFNEVFFSDVLVPNSCLIGTEGEGWNVANSTLSHERGTSPRQLVIHIQLFEELIRLALSNGSFETAGKRHELARAYAAVKIFQLLNWRSLSRLERGEEPGPESSILKLYWTEMSQDLHNLAMELLGSAAPLSRGARYNPGEGAWQRSWLYYQAASIFGGTNEIQRNVIGERVLGLPREPRGEANSPRASEKRAHLIAGAN